MSVPSRRPVTEAAVKLLADLTGRPIGNQQAPSADPATGLPARPYAVLYALDGGVLEGGGWTDQPTDALWPYQLTSVGDTPEQAEWMADFARTVLFSLTDHLLPAPDLDGSRSLVIGRISQTVGAPAPEGTVWNVHERFALGVTTT